MGISRLESRTDMRYHLQTAGADARDADLISAVFLNLRLIY